MSVVPEWIPLKSKLEQCAVSKFQYYWFDNQADLSWDNIKINKELYINQDANKGKFFVCRAKKLINNLLTYAKSHGIHCETDNRPKGGTQLNIWRQNLVKSTELLHQTLLQELKEEDLLITKKKTSDIKFHSFHNMLNKLIVTKYKGKKNNNPEKVSL